MPNETVDPNNQAGGDPKVTVVNVHNVTAEHVHVEEAGPTTWVSLGPVAFFGNPDQLAAIGREIARQATALKGGAR